MRAFFLVCLIGFGLANMAQAGTWTKLDDNDGASCDYLFSGEIEKGDITGFLQSNPKSDNAFRLVPIICLDSPGGHLGDVLQAIEMMKWKNTVGTHIKSGHQCLSACAILFLYGQQWGVNSPYPSRTMESGATLGFHSPFPSRSYTVQADVSQLLATAVALLDKLYDGVYVDMNGDGPAIAPEVLSMVLKTPSDQMYVVDTVFELSMLGIDLIGGETARRVGIPKTGKAFNAAVERICATSYIVTHRNYHLQNGYLFRNLVARIDDLITETQQSPPSRVVLFGGAEPRVVALDAGGYWVPGWFSAGAALYCRVDFDVEVKGDMVWVNDYSVHFIGATPIDDDEIPEVDEHSQQGDAVGLVPITTRF